MGAVEQFRSLASVLTNRLAFFNRAGITFGGRRDMYSVLGYPRILGYIDYRDRYLRDGIAKRIVEAYPKATWRGGVEVFEDEDPNTDTEFEKAFKSIDARLNIWSRLQSVDTLAGLSSYAVLLIGSKGEGDLSTELPKGSGPDDLIYLEPFSGGGGVRGTNNTQSQAVDADCSIASFDTDPRSPRFGDPLTYQLRRTSISSPYLARPVHWSRILHVAEGCLFDNVYGIPTLENVWNLMDDLAKVTGGGAEAFWLRANAGLHLDVDKDMTLGAVGADASVELDKLKAQADDYANQMTRMMRTRGVKIEQLGSDVANFNGPADAIMKQIAGSKGIPMRILTGSEMGTLASEQDAANFDSQVQDRRTGYAGPLIVRRFVNRLIEYGYLPTPKKYEVGWPVEENMDEAGKAKFALDLANINKTYGATVFDDIEIRDMAFDKSPLPEKQPWENLTELDKATLAAKLALVNKEMGITVYTDDEIREMSHGFAPLTDAEKVPIGAPEKISVAAPPKIGEDGLPMPQEGQTIVPPAKVPASKEPIAKTLKALEEAIEANDLVKVGELIGVTAR